MPNDEPFVESAPQDRFCDLVMKGGITSGVVYPLAILELARSFRFKNIGGTSAGAIAAVVTAAAEYRRRHGSAGGFEVLRQLPKTLGEQVGERSRLLTLFKPQPQTRRLFGALLASLNRPNTGRRWLAALWGFATAYGRYALAGIAVGAVLACLAAGAHFRTVFAAAPLALIGAVIAIVWGVCRDVTQGLVPNGFGLCQCGPDPARPNDPPALVPWLHRLIQDTAGLRKEDPPLTFQTLWSAPGFPPDWLKDAAQLPLQSINLQVFTTSLTHGRPFHLPLQDDSSRLFFKASELKSYFPDDVLAHMVKHAKAYAPRGDSDPPASSVDPELLELPYGELPIVVAARLSLSFPVLISAVPLWAIDYVPERSKRTLKPCWFSDGGISSNFPIHLFDGFLPMWPTFGITLGAREAARPDEEVWVPQQHLEGRADGWNRFAEKDNPWSRLGGFVASIVSAAQNWNDATAARMPGVRDRVAHVLLLPDEGGLNLNMPSALIANLASYGDKAGRKLRDKFLPDQVSNPPTVGWKEHRWVRFNVLLHGLRERVRGLHVSGSSVPYAVPLRDQIAAALCKPPLCGTEEKALSPDQAKALDELLTSLESLELAFAKWDTEQPYHPLPQPAVRVRTPL